MSTLYSLKRILTCKGLILIIILLLQGREAYPLGQGFVYTMVDVCDGALQGDAHLLRFDNGKVYAIDAGSTSKFANYLIKKNIHTIDRLFISHWHKDHYRGIQELVKAKITIGEIYGNGMPDRLLCDKEVPWGCDYEDIAAVLNYLKKRRYRFILLKPEKYFTPRIL